jgi:hypothetical protein
MCITGVQVTSNAGPIIAIPINEINEMSKFIQLRGELYGFSGSEYTTLVVFDGGKDLSQFWKHYIVPCAELIVSFEQLNSPYEACPKHM